MWEKGNKKRKTILTMMICGVVAVTYIKEENFYGPRAKAPL